MQLRLSWREKRGFPLERRVVQQFDRIPSRGNDSISIQSTTVVPVYKIHRYFRNEMKMEKCRLNIETTFY